MTRTRAAWAGPSAPGELSCDAITGEYRILQRRRGHRYSLDDVATAWEAANVAPGARSYADLGCGVGSVLLMVAYKLQSARVVGVEALGMSAELARRNLALNGLEPRATIVDGDLREVSRDWRYGACELVTGTPPYLPEGTALGSPDPQRRAARIELRGGVEDYLAAAARILAPGGRVVVCAGARHPERVFRGAEAAGLAALRRRDVIPRQGAAALLSVWVLGRREEHQPAPPEHLAVAVRDAAGEPTAEAVAMRRWFGLAQ